MTFIEYPKHYQEYSSAILLIQIKNEYAKKKFNIDHHYQCNENQLKELNIYMNEYYYNVYNL